MNYSHFEVKTLNDGKNRVNVFDTLYWLKLFFSTKYLCLNLNSKLSWVAINF